MNRFICVSNWIGNSILRVAAEDELLSISSNNCALLVEDDSSSSGAGFAIYLLCEGSSASVIDSFKRSGARPYCILPEGCFLTPGQFIQIVGDGREATLTLQQSGDIPDRMLFFTGRCNSNCVMCPYTTKWREEAVDTVLPTLKRYMALMNPYAPYICITGGEPTLLGRDFLALLRLMQSHFSGTLIHILTNGRAFCYPDFYAEYKQVRPQRTLLGIPLYAHLPTLHDAITHVSGSFNETVAGLDLLYAGGEKIELRIVLTAQNIPVLGDLADLIIQRYPRIYMVSLMGMEMMGNAYLHRQQVWLPYESITLILSNAVNKLVLHGVQTQIYNMPLCKVDRQHWSLCKKSISGNKVAYTPECERCSLRSICGGFFVTNLKMPAISVAPIGE